MHGKGTYIYAHADVYDGEWKDGNMHGKGKMTYAHDDGEFFCLGVGGKTPCQMAVFKMECGKMMNSLDPSCLHWYVDQYLWNNTKSEESCWAKLQRSGMYRQDARWMNTPPHLSSPY